MNKKIKVVNDNKFDYGLSINIGSPKKIVVKAKAFVTLDQDEVYYIDSTSRTFRDGFLRVKDEETKQGMGQDAENPNAITTEEVEKLLTGNIQKMKKELKEIKSKHAIDKVIDKAKELDLTTGKLKIIKELFDVDIFEDVSNEIV